MNVTLVHMKKKKLKNEDNKVFKHIFKWTKNLLIYNFTNLYNFGYYQLKAIARYDIADMQRDD